MNLLISCGVFHPRTGGAESLFLDLSTALAGRGHQVTVLTRHLDAGTAAHEILDGIHVVRLAWPVPYEKLRFDRRFVLGSPRALHRTWKLLRARRVTSVCIGLLDMSAMYLLALRPLLRFRLTTYLHGAEVRALPRDSAAFRRLVGRCLAASDAVVAVSSSLADTAVRAFPVVRDKLTVIPNGIDLARLAGAAVSTRARPYLLYLGRLAGEKNVSLIVEAFARVADRIPDVDLVLAGSGPEREALQALARSYGLLGSRIELCGEVDRARAFGLVKGARFLVLASDSESHPLVAIEAIAAGRAVVAPRVTGLDDMIEDAVHGALYPPGDRDALGELLVEYAADGGARAAVERHLASADRSHLDLQALVDRHLRVLEPAA